QHYSNNTEMVGQRISAVSMQTHAQQANSRTSSVTALTDLCPLSGYVMVCHFQSDQLVRQLHLVDLQKSWNDAQQYCRDEYIDLAIVNSSALIQEAQKWAGSTEVWIGLSKSGWKWSRLRTGECVTISSNGSWFTRQYDLLCNSTNFHLYTLTAGL
uniref:C-type lectin domain-containing protein n=1 Tax=Maylandia zebra TaxID=106582 RepID=A0A3P9BRZ2_9CICH